MLAIGSLPIASKAPENYRPAIQKIQNISWKNSDLKNESQSMARLAYKAYPQTLGAVSAAYILFVKKEFTITQKNFLIEKSDINLDVNMVNKSYSLKVKIPFEVR